MSRIDIKLILIASLSAGILNGFLFPFVQTLLSFADIKLDRPIGAYLLRGYFVLILAGLYAGYFAKNCAFINGILVGIVYSITFYLISISVIVLKGTININWISILYSLIENGIICGMVTWATFKFTELLKNKNQQKV